MKKVIIVGTNAAAWLAALALRRQLNADVTVIELKDSNEHLRRAMSLDPSVHQFHQLMQFDEKALLKAAKGCFQLATHYLNAAPVDKQSNQSGYDFVHSYSPVGVDLDGFGFQHYYQKYKGTLSRSFEDYSLSCHMAKRNKFVHPVNNQQSILSTLQYGLQLDTRGYKDYCRNQATRQGAKSIASENVTLNLESWEIASLKLDSGLTLSADLYIDTTDDGLVHRMLLPKEVDYYSLPCTKVVRFKGGSATTLSTNTRMQAIQSGILKSTPLADRIEYEMFFNDQLTDDEVALTQAQAISGVPDSIDAEFHMLNKSRPDALWKGNCVALGEYAGWPNPILGGEIQSVHRAISRVIELFPAGSSHQHNASEFNRLSDIENNRLYEFQLNLFHLTHQPNSEFWQQANQCSIPELLQHRLTVFEQGGKIAKYEGDPYAPAFWLSFLFGIGLEPTHYDPLLDMQNTDTAIQKVARIADIIGQTLPSLPEHRDYLQRFLQY